MKMIHTGGPHGDSCSSYDVMLGRTYTVKEFVEEILGKQEEWGEIVIAADFQCMLTNPTDRCEYRGGNISKDFREKGTEGKIISEAKANGGWSRMDYYVVCH